jgi:hypothetical protein
LGIKVLITLRTVDESKTQAFCNNGRGKEKSKVKDKQNECI